MTMLPPQGQNSMPVPVDAPRLGIIAENIYGLSSDFGFEAAVYMYNVIPGEFGARVRPGSADHANTIPDATTEIRTVMHYNTVAGSSTKIFAATDQGIYDITTGGAGPHTQVVTWGVAGVNAGWCSFINYTNASGDYLLVCDEDNGYIYYDGTTWTTVPAVTGVSAGDLVHVTEWQGRLFFTEKSTGSAWFLAPLAISGAATQFFVGDRFKAGGNLVMNTTWTVDAGDGINDKFVQISSEGDVIIWEGINPTAATDITMIGRWDVGAVPAGRRIMTDWGGDVAIITKTGIIKITTLLSAKANLSKDQYLTRNIGKYFREQMAEVSTVRGWALEFVPNEGIAVVTIPQPTATSRAPMQFIMNTATEAWGMFRDLDMVSMVKTSTGFQFGTTTGEVKDFEGTTDDSESIDFSWLTHFSGMGNPAVWKIPAFIRSYWVGGGAPSVLIKAKYDFDLEEDQDAVPASMITGALWDAAIWDDATWESDNANFQFMHGLSGMGHHVALSYRGSTSAVTNLVGSELTGHAGGLL